MIQFLQNYWMYLAGGVVVVAEIIIFFLKKAPSVNYDDHIKSSIDSAVLYYIKLAELSGAVGSEKLAFVVSMIMKRIKLQFGSSEHDEEYWRSYVVEKVEAVLTTPQKKGL